MRTGVAAGKLFDFQNKPVIVLTIDVDWAPRPCLQDTLELLADRGVKATFFVTRGTDASLLDGHALAVHPNFAGSFSTVEDYRRDLEEIIREFPRARGLRTHALHNSYYMQVNLRDPKLAIAYTSNYYIPMTEGLQPIFCQSLRWELPIYFMDHLNMEMAGRVDRDNILSDLRNPGLKVMAFHPFHIYLNSQDMAHVAKAKPYYQEPDKLRQMRGNGYGIRDLFLDVLALYKAKDYTWATCEEVVASLERPAWVGAF